MKKNQIIDHYERELATFYQYFNKTLKNPEVEDIHQMRVSIKKLRAIWILMEIVSHGKWKKEAYFALFEKLFQAAGKLRETQVNLALVQQLKADFLSGYTEYQSNKEKAYEKKLVLYMQEFNMKKLETLNEALLKKMQKIPGKTLLKEAIVYLTKKNKKVLEIKGMKSDNRKFHKIRIQLKAVQEILAIVEELNANTILETLQSQIKLLNHQIGKWHDYSILLKSLKKFIKKSPDNESIQLVKGLIGRIKDEQKERQSKIYKLIDKHLAPQQLKQIQKN